MLKKCIKSAVEVQLKCIDDMTENRKIQNQVIWIGWLFVAADGPFRKGPIMTTEFTSIQTSERPGRDWAAIRGELSIYLLAITAGILAFTSWENAALQREQIAVVKQVHVQLDAYAHITRDALARLESQPPMGTSHSAAVDDQSNHSPAR